MLTALGPRRIALLHSTSRLNFATDRELGYREALTAAGLSANADLVFGDPMHEDSGFSRATQLLEHPAPPTAFLCSSIGQAAGVRRACSLRGLKVGEDVPLIAHDDRLHDLRAENFDPPLTTTQSPIGNAGRRIVELLVSMLRNPDAPLPAEIWPVDLVVRNSTPGPRRS